MRKYYRQVLAVLIVYQSHNDSVVIAVVPVFHVNTRFYTLPVAWNLGWPCQTPGRVIVMKLILTYVDGSSGTTNEPCWLENNGLLTNTERHCLISGYIWSVINRTWSTGWLIQICLLMGEMANLLWHKHWLPSWFSVCSEYVRIS